MARDMKAQAPGPAGADRKPVADLLFILSADMVRSGQLALRFRDSVQALL